MAERVSTGGNVSFEYKKGKDIKLDEERKQDIKKGYEKYYERKRRERQRKNLIIGVGITIEILIIIFLIFIL